MDLLGDHAADTHGDGGCHPLPQRDDGADVDDHDTSSGHDHALELLGSPSAVLGIEGDVDGCLTREWVEQREQIASARSRGT